VRLGPHGQVRVVEEAIRPAPPQHSRAVRPRRSPGLDQLVRELGWT